MLHEALRIRYTDGLAADDDERAAYDRSIYGRSALWHKLGITGLTGTLPSS
ncbi:hypothetical protein ACIBKY_38535 [Nonomuraea sp. NPDC050394]|uniref:hypothetical protein n=1 Tax=Nonomuraea sp. NPDC050394 TaxID=3364363 RepID=UPI00378F2482